MKRLAIFLILTAVFSANANGQSGSILMQLDCISVSGIGKEMQPLSVTEDIICFTDNQFFIYSRDCETIEYINLDEKMLYSVIPSVKKGCKVSLDTLESKEVDMASVFGEDGMKASIDTIPDGNVKYGGFNCEKQRLKVAVSGKGVKVKINMTVWGDPDVPMNKKLREAVSLCAENDLFSNVSIGRMGVFPDIVRMETDFNFSAFLVINGSVKTLYDILWYKPEVTYAKAFQLPDDTEFIDRESYAKIMKQHNESLCEERAKAKGKGEYRIENLF